MGQTKMEQPTQVEQTQEVAAPAAAALPTPSQGKKCKTFKKVKNLPANRGPRKPCKSLLKRKKRTCSVRRRKKSTKVSRRRKCSSKKVSRRRKRSSRRRKAAKRSRRRRK